MRFDNSLIYGRAVLSLVAILITGCPSRDSGQNIRVDGSSTVYPITEAVAEEYQKKEPKARVTIGSGGTGSGFAKFCRGEIGIADASRPIKKSEEASCEKNNVKFLELPIAYDGMVVVVHPKATWINNITTDELKRLFEPSAQGKLMKWNQLNPSWPDENIHLFSPGNDSGTFDYFTAAIVGKEKASRGDITSSEDDNVLVQGVATDTYALGYFGYAYYIENKDRLKALSINQVAPSKSAILDRSYKPLSRPIFIYLAVTNPVNKATFDFVTFYLEKGSELVEKVGYIPLQESVLNLVKRRFNERKTGSVFGGEEMDPKATLEAILTNAK